jgi:hypothetical protein
MTRSRVPAGGASPRSGCKSARYWTIATPPLGQHRTVVEPKRRHIPIRVYGGVFAARRHDVRRLADVDTLEFERDAHFVSDDVR